MLQISLKTETLQQDAVNFKKKYTLCGLFLIAIVFCFVFLFGGGGGGLRYPLHSLSFSIGDSETTRILSSLFDILVIFVSFVSIILTMRSILRAQKLRKVPHDSFILQLVLSHYKSIVSL